MAADDVSLPDLEVIAQFSLAVRAATAPRAQVVAALEADLAALTGQRRTATAPAGLGAGPGRRAAAPAAGAGADGRRRPRPGPGPPRPRPPARAPARPKA